MTVSPNSDQARTTPLRSLARSAVRIVGIIIALVSIGYVGRAIVQNQIWQTNTASLTQIIGVAILGGSVYAVINVILSGGWWQILVNQGVVTPFRQSHRIYSRSQIAKYIPGNVFHYGSRHVLGTMAGIGQANLIASAALEANRMIVAAVLLSALGLRNWAVAVAAGIVIDGFVMRRIRKTSIAEWLETLKGMAALVGLYLAFFAACGLILWGIAWVVLGDSASLSVRAAMAAYAAAWVVGFVVPGASAGIGVRETLLIVGLTGLVGGPESVSIALLMRVATVFGDVLFFASSQVIRQPG
jgi:hypothetical protein